MARHLPPVLSNQAVAEGAIAQLGERVVRNDEVGGSIPPGSTTLRPSGYAWRSRAKPEGRSVPGVALLGEDGLAQGWRVSFEFRKPVDSLRATRGAAAQSLRGEACRRSPLGRRRAGDVDVV